MLTFRAPVGRSDIMELRIASINNLLVLVYERFARNPDWSLLFLTKSHCKLARSRVYRPVRAVGKATDR